MKRLILILSLMAGVAGAQTTTYTGTIKDLSLNVVTSGQVAFTLAQPVSSTIPGTGVFVPATVYCNINGDGSLSGYVAGVVIGACIVASNTAISPSGTAYKICVQPNYSAPRSCFYDYATTSTKDISTVAPTLQTSPLNYGGVAGPQGPIGAPTSGVNLTPASSQIVVQPSGTSFGIKGAGTLNGTNSGGQSSLNGFSISQIGVNPSSYGLPSNGVATSTTGSIASGSATLTVASAAFINKYNGIFVGHAGAACGVTRGTACPSGPGGIAIMQGGTAGSTSYTYRVSCIDGLGGYSAASSPTTTATGNAALSATNYNIITLGATAGCIEVAVYRNNVLIGEKYAPLSGTYPYLDQGQAAVASHRDIPLTPPSSAAGDNLVALVTAVSGTEVTLSTNAGASVSGAFTMLSDTPLLQAAVATGTSIVGDSNYRLNYPLSLVDFPGYGPMTFSAICDTGDICVDATGQYELSLDNVSLNSFATLTAPSTIGLFCARDASRTYSQLFNTTNLFLTLSSPTMSGAGNSRNGTVGFYNYACEVETHDHPQINASEPLILTSTNIRNVQSVFDSTQLAGTQSMSAINIYGGNLNSTNGAMIVADNMYTLHVDGGYGFGGDSVSHPYMIEAFNGGLGNSYIHDYRTEGVAGFIHIFHGSSFIDNDILENQFHDVNPTVPIFQLDANAFLRENHIQVNALTISNTQPFFNCADSTCSIFSNPYISVTSGESWNAASAQQSDNWVCIWDSTCSYSGTIQAGAWATTSNCSTNSCGSAASGRIVFPAGTATETITTSSATINSNPSLTVFYTSAAPTNITMMGPVAVTNFTNGSFTISFPVAPAGNAVGVIWNLVN